MNYTKYDSPVGCLLLASDEGCLTGLWMDEREATDWIFYPSDPVLVQTVSWLDAYFAGSQPEVQVPVSLPGTAFQRQVWEILMRIPYGEVRTYGDIARELERINGKRMSAQAVGGAVGKNPVSILVPCHRVVGSGGKLTGYAWGIEKKAWLLRHEGWKGMEI